MGPAYRLTVLCLGSGRGASAFCARIPGCGCGGASGSRVAPVRSARAGAVRAHVASRNACCESVHATLLRCSRRKLHGGDCPPWRSTSTRIGRPQTGQ